jgi:hypothetical protein
MNDHTNAVAGAGIASAAISGLWAQAVPGTIGLAGSLLALAIVLVRAVHEIALRWIDWQTRRIDAEALRTRITELETEIANYHRLASHGYCPLDPAEAGQPACLRPAPKVAAA